MELGLREALVLVGIVAIGWVVFDAWKRRSRRGTVVKLELQQPQRNAPRVDEKPDINPELPGGGARVVRREPRLGAPADPSAVGMAAVTPPASMAAGAPVLIEPVAGREVEQVDMFGDEQIPAASPAPAQAIRERGELPRRDAPPRKPEAAPSKPPAPEEIVVLHVMAREGRLPGKPLLEVLLSCGLRFGEMGIFHRYESNKPGALAMFSMANAVEPGIFDIDAMDSQDFVGVSFFLMLPGPENARQALDTMLDCARRVAEALGAELRDAGHSALTPQSAEHLRQRIAEYERRRLLGQRGNG